MTIAHIAAAVCFMLPWIAQGQVHTLAELPGIGNAAARVVLSLDGAWDAIVDPFDTGTLDYKSRPQRHGFWEDRARTGPLDLVEYSIADAIKLRVPGDWNTQRPELFLYEGAVWYRRVFEFDRSDPDAAGPRRFVRIGAANRRSAVWLNGQKLGEHPVGFTPAVYEVTDLIRRGENTLIVRVDNRRDTAGVPGMLTDWWNYGGITRPVEILETPGTYIRDFHASLAADRSRVRGWVAVDGADRAGRRVRIRIADRDVECITDNAGMAHWEVDAGGLALWSPEAPALHELRAEIAAAERASGDVFVDRIGLRTIATAGGRILLNGEPIGLRGVCVHEEQISGDGRSWSEAHARELAARLKELNCNFVRLAHYPHAEIVSRVMDEAGILVWAEVPVYWTLDYGNPRTLDLALTHIRGLIGRDHNRASVIIWSIGNETGADDQRTGFRNALAAEVRRLDDSRLLAAALEASQKFEDGRVVKVTLDDPFAASVDVMAINSYIGWYSGRIEDMESLPIEVKWDKPFIVSEFGAGAKRGLPGGDEEIWTEAYQARLLAATMRWMKDAPNFAGCSPWILSDFRSPRRLLPGVQDWWNRKGLLDEDGVPKLAFGVVRDVYAEWAAAWPNGDDAVVMSGNPVFEGWYADPEAVVFGDEVWIYPTFSARYDQQRHFDAFSSKDLVHWTKHERILTADAVKWARRAMWAPAVIEKGGRYFFFFGANDIQTDSETGGIGVAVSDAPGGPFEDYLGKPLIDKFHNGAQPIDQFVFRDVDGTDYLIYGGWRHCNIAKLADDYRGFVPFDDGTTFKEITPAGYVEGPFMFRHNGKYYFMWSEGGWTGPDYSVAYAIADSPLGPFERIGKILQQDPKIATGAGHHSVFKAPGTDDWYIVYHRRPKGETDRDHRVVCIDRMEFDADGRIKPVVITQEGVARLR